MAGKLDRINKIHKVIHCDRRSRFSYYRRKNIVNSNRDFEVFRFGTGQKSRTNMSTEPLWTEPMWTEREYLIGDISKLRSNAVNLVQ